MNTIAINWAGLPVWLGDEKGMWSRRLLDTSAVNPGYPYLPLLAAVAAVLIVVVCRFLQMPFTA